MLSRRDFLKSSSLIALAPTVPTFLAHAARAAVTDHDSRVLVVVQLDGGNDGINTIIPFGDDGYGRNRKQLRIADDQIIKIDDHVGFHPAMQDLAKLLQTDRLAVIQGVGYPNPNRSHDVSMGIWHTCSFDHEDHKGQGWLGRALDHSRRPNVDGPAALLVGRESPPVAIQGRQSVASVLDDLNDYALADNTTTTSAESPSDQDDDIAAFVRRSTLDAYTTAEQLKAISQSINGEAAYPRTELARRLSLIAQLIKSGFGTRVYYVVQSGYDTHYVQSQAHANLLEEFSSALRAFLDDLGTSNVGDRVAVLAFSEFGRRVEENASMGTDHGTAGPVILAGSRVEAGLVGATPSLTDLDDGDLKWSIDFRQIYATLLNEWLRIPPIVSVGKQFDSLPLFKTT